MRFSRLKAWWHIYAVTSAYIDVVRLMQYREWEKEF